MTAQPLGTFGQLVFFFFFFFYMVLSPVLLCVDIVSSLPFCVAYIFICFLFFSFTKKNIYIYVYSLYIFL